MKPKNAKSRMHRIRTITAHRLSIQFDTHRQGNAEVILRKMLDEFTDELKHQFPINNPQITVDS